MNTRKANTRFMNGNIDFEGIIADIINNEFGYGATFICWDEAIYSDNFITAIENGLIPQIHTIEFAHSAKKYGEYHHFIYEDECYVVYFK